MRTDRTDGHGSDSRRVTRGQQAERRDRHARYGIGAAAITGAVVSALVASAAYNVWRARKSERDHPPIGRFIESDGVRLHYVEKGSGQPVVLLAGNGAVLEDWIVAGVFDRAAQFFRVIAIDRPGFGYSERPRDRLWTPAEQARVLYGALRQLGVEKPILVGQSLGTMVALAMAIDHQNDIGGLVLIAGYYFPTARADVAFFASPAIPVLGDAMRYTISPLIGRLITPAMLKRLFAPRPVSWHFKDEFPVGLALRPSQIRATAQDSAFMIPAATVLQQRYFALGVPTVLMAGDGDRIVDPVRQTKRLHRHVPRSVLYMVPGAGHMVHHLVPSQVVDAMRAVSKAELPATPIDRTTAVTAGPM